MRKLTLEEAQKIDVMYIYANQGAIAIIDNTKRRAVDKLRWK